MSDKTLYIFAGCNGAGKTTAFEGTLLFQKENFMQNHTSDYLNSDIIARGLSPFDVASVEIQAGRLLIERMKALLYCGKSFIIETTLSGKTLKNYFELAASLEYKLIMYYYWLNSVELSKKRVKIRTIEGGHYIPEDILERRYYRGIKNLFSIYLPIVDSAFLFDNSNEEPYLFAKYEKNNQTIIHKKIFNQIYKLWQINK